MLTLKRLRSVAAVIILAMFVSSCADDQIDVEAGQAPGTEDPAPSTDTVGLPVPDHRGPPGTVDEIVTLVDLAAEGLGEAEPSDIEWVSSSRRAANLLISESVVGASEDDVDVLVIQARGDFTVPGTSGPPDPETGQTAPPATGEFLNIILDSTSGQLLDYGVHHAAANLSQLGEVERPPEA